MGTGVAVGSVGGDRGSCLREVGKEPVDVLDQQFGYSPLQSSVSDHRTVGGREEEIGRAHV